MHTPKVLRTARKVISQKPKENNVKQSRLVFDLLLILVFVLKLEGVAAQTLSFTELTETELGIKFPEGMDAMSFGDFDNDGDLDLLLSGEYQMGMPWGKYLTKVYKNENGKFSEYPTNLIGVNSRSVGWIDVDSDGDLDIYVYGLSGYDEDFNAIYVSKMYINNNGVFSESEFPIKTLIDAEIAWGDYDNDGDPDLAISGGSTMFGQYSTIVYENRNGTFVEKINLTGIGYGKPTVSWFDFDKDGDLDLLATGNTTAGGTKGITSKIFINNNGSFSDSKFDLPGVDYAMVNFADYNNDGYFDILLTGQAYYKGYTSPKISKIYYNSNLSYKFSDTLSANLAYGYSGNALSADFNNDGQIDILLTGTFGNIFQDNITPKLYLNNGNGFDTLNFQFPTVKNIAMGDFDNDGDLDIILSGKTGHYMNGTYTTKFYRNETTVSNSPPVYPDSCKTIINEDSIVLCWSKAHDDGLLSTMTNQKSLSYNIYLKCNDSIIVSPNSILENGFRKIIAYGNAQLDTFKILKNLPSGRYEWGVQTIDNSFRGSSFSPVQSFLYCSKFITEAGSDKTIICGGEAQIDSAIIYNSGKGILNFTWQPGEGLDSAHISNPKVYANESKKFYLSVTSTNGCSATDSVMIFVNPLLVNTGSDKSITCGGKVKFDIPITNYTGLGVLAYSWLPALGLDSTKLPQPTTEVISDTEYILEVTTPNGCKAIDSLKVTVKPLPLSMPGLIVPCGNSVQLNAATQYTGSGSLTYCWTPETGLSATNIADPIATVDTATSYSVEITTPNGCVANDEVNIIMSVTSFAQSICLVTVDENDKNLVVWQRVQNPEIDSIYIYRESSLQTDQYNLIGKVKNSESFVFVDSSSNARVQSNKYKICAKDACGFITNKSLEHKTMHLTINKGIGNNWNLIWEQYIGISVSSYKIYRGTTKSNLTEIGTLSGSNTTYTDETAPDGDVYYQIEVVFPQPCSSLKSTMYSSSRSNIMSNLEAKAIYSKSPIKASIYPNPASDKLNIINTYSSNGTIIIFDIKGIQVLNKHFEPEQIDISCLPKGIYFVKLIESGKVMVEKLIIE